MQDEIADLVYPILSYGLRLKERLDNGETASLELEQSVLKGLLLSSVEAQKWASFGGDPREGLGVYEIAGADLGDQPEKGRFLGIRYALVCWLDEIFTIDSPWAARWNEQKLEASLYGSNDRAWRFWDQAKQAESRPETDPLEVFFLCVMLGFRGELRELSERLWSWGAAAQSRVARLRGREWTPPSELDPQTRVPPLHGREAMQRMVLLGGLTFLLLIPLVAFFVVRSLSG